MQEEQQPATPAAPDVVNQATPQAVGLQQLCEPLYDAKGWMKLAGILMVAMGILQALTCLGLIVAWIPIWMGVLLLGVSKLAEQAYAQDDISAFLEAMRKLKTFFTIMGVIFLIYIFFFVFGLVVGIIVPLLTGGLAALQNGF